jgi:hypothetical protein
MQVLAASIAGTVAGRNRIPLAMWRTLRVEVLVFLQPAIAGSEFFSATLLSLAELAASLLKIDREDRVHGGKQVLL